MGTGSGVGSGVEVGNSVGVGGGAEGCGVGVGVAWGVGSGVGSGAVMGNTVEVGRGAVGCGVGVGLSVGAGGGKIVEDVKVGLADRGSSATCPTLGSRDGMDRGVAVGLGAIVDSTAGTATPPQATAADIKIPSINETKPRIIDASPPPMDSFRVI